MSKLGDFLMKWVIFKVIELDKEKSRTEMAFHDFVPPAVVKRIKSKKGKEVRTRRD